MWSIGAGTGAAVMVRGRVVQIAAIRLDRAILLASVVLVRVLVMAMVMMSMVLVLARRVVARRAIAVLAAPASAAAASAAAAAAVAIAFAVGMDGLAVARPVMRRLARLAVRIAMIFCRRAVRACGA